MIPLEQLLKAKPLQMPKNIWRKAAGGLESICRFLNQSNMKNQTSMMYQKTFAFLIGCLFCLPVFSQIHHWETVVYSTDEWRYFVGQSAPPSNWKQANFDDSIWLLGAGGIGYADGDDNTIITATPSLFMRRKFEVVDLSKIEAAILHADYDDAFVAYLNGVEIARANIEGTSPAFYADAIEGREAVVYEGGRHEPYFLGRNLVKELLQNGENTLAIQVHNKFGESSSDMSAIFFMSLGIADDSNDYRATPEWFESPEFSSHLPILTIETSGQEILDDPRIVADFGIIWNGEGNLNYSLGEANEYAGKINIELRGSSSLYFPKNNYAIETINEAGEDIDTSFLDFPTEEDWVLHGPFSDKTLLRNVLTMHLAREMGQYASRTRFVELSLNGNYHGVYVLMEKIKRDKERVDIAKLRETDVEGDELTGGYIFKVDRGEVAWLSEFNMWKNNWQKLPYVLVYPDLEDIQPTQLGYIESYVDSFERAVMSSDYHFAGKRYDEFIDSKSFAEHFILNELGKNVDAYRLSSYFYKKKDSDGGKIHAGPIWDFNLAFNNADYGDAWITNGWLYYISGAAAEPAWWNRMLQDPVFKNTLRCRWEELRLGLLDVSSIFGFIDGQVEELGEAVNRNFERWDILDEYVWPNPEVSGSYEGEITNLKTWIAHRIGWLDGHMFGECNVVNVEEWEASSFFEVFPNPSNKRIFVSLNKNLLPANAQLYVSDVLGRKVKDFPANEFSLEVSELSNGVYFVILEMGEGQRYWRKVVVY